MGRTLPWLLEPASPTKHTTSTSRAGTARLPVTRRPKKSNRTPSTSPPPAPPPQELMRKSDRAWIMVEDEFLATANSLTRGLHIAEYHRLRSLAQRSKDHALNQLQRPTDSRTQMSTELRLKKAREQQDGKARIGSPDNRRRAAESCGSECDVPIGDRHLAGLMQAAPERKKKVLEEPHAASRSITRNVVRHGPQVLSSDQKSPAELPTQNKLDGIIPRRAPGHAAKAPVEATSPPPPPEHGSLPRSPFRRKRGIGVEQAKPTDPSFAHDDGSTDHEPIFEEPRKERPKPRLLKRRLVERSDQATTSERRKTIKLEEIPLFLA